MKAPLAVPALDFCPFLLPSLLEASMCETWLSVCRLSPPIASANTSTHTFKEHAHLKCCPYVFNACTPLLFCRHVSTVQAGLFVVFCIFSQLWVKLRLGAESNVVHHILLCQAQCPPMRWYDRKTNTWCENTGREQKLPSKLGFAVGGVSQKQLPHEWFVSAQLLTRLQRSYEVLGATR